MDRTANVIEFEHPSRPKRAIRFERTGKKAIHATGGVWGERDWFETLHPDGAAMLAILAQRIAGYLAQGFSIARVRVHDRRAAGVLGLTVSARPKAIAVRKKEERTKAQRSALELLATPLPTAPKALRAELRTCKALYARPLGAPLRRRVRARLEALDQALKPVPARKQPTTHENH